MDKTNKSKSGFSYVEVVIATYLLLVGIVALAQLITKGTALAIESRDEIIAAQLAQEGTELVRNLRDNNWIHGNLSFQGFPATPPSASDTCLDVTTDTIAGVNLPNNCAFPAAKLYVSGGKYVHGSGTQTSFARIIRISGTADEKTVRSIVVWDRTDFPASCNTANRCTYAETLLTRWLE